MEKVDEKTTRAILRIIDKLAAAAGLEGEIPLYAFDMMEVNIMNGNINNVVDFIESLVENR